MAKPRFISTSIRLLIGSLAFSLLWSPALKAQQPSKSLRVAVPLALTGIAAQQSENIRRGIELAKQDLEKQGWAIDLAYADTTASAAQVVSTVKSLLVRNYRFFIGPTWSYMVAAARPSYEQSGSVAFSPATSSEIIGAPSPNILHGTPKYSGEYTALAAWLAQQNARKALVIVSDTTWGNLHRGVFRKAAQDKQVKILFEDSYPLDSEDAMTPMFALKVKQLQPDVALVDFNKNGAALFLRKLKELGVKVKVLGTHKLREAFDLGLISDDAISGGIWIFDLPVSPSFRDRFKQLYGEETEMHSDSSYDLLMLLAHATENTDGSPRAVLQYLREMKPYHGYGGTYSFDSNGDCARAQWTVRDLGKAD